MKIFKDKNIPDNEYIWDLVDCALYCWTFCHKINSLLLIVTFWVQTISLVNLVYKNDKGFVHR